jgi:hypothetical protein
MPMNNVDDLLRAEISKVQPDLAAPPIEEVSRGTEGNTEGKNEGNTADASADKAGNEAAVSATNEYGDKAEEPSKVAPEPEKAEDKGDEYGLESEEQKTYTKAEMNEYANRLVRERLARLERNSGQQFTQQQVQQQAQQAQKDFQYDENSSQDWQQQLKEFVKQTNIEQQQEYARQIQQAQEQQRMAEFESKFIQGMNKFTDYHEVVRGKNISDHMVMAARGIKDPASFFYAAAKRAPDELAKIAQEPDPYAQAAAIGRLDAMLRKQAQKASNAPRPVSQTKEDAPAPTPKAAASRYENELDNLLVADQRKRLELINSRRR